MGNKRLPTLRGVVGRLRTFALRRIWNVMALYYWMQMLQRPALRRLYRHYRRISQSTGVNVWDAVILYDTVRNDKPRYVLEFGTGASTAFIALAIKDNEREDPAHTGSIVSVESERTYLDHQMDIFPTELRRHVEFVHGPVTTKEFAGKRGFVHGSVPTLPYDLIWVDGPALTDEVRFSGDVIDLLPTCAPYVRVMFDGRDETAATVYSFLGKQYRIKRFPHLHMTEIRARNVGNAGASAVEGARDGN